MPRDLSAEQLANASAVATRPVTLVAWAYSGAIEYRSCSGVVTFDGNNYAEGGCSVANLKDSTLAQISIPADPTTLAQMIAGTWNRGECKIYLIPAQPGDSGIYTASQAIVMLDGYLTSARYSGGKIVVQARHKNYDGNYTPRNLIDEVASVLPPAGTILALDAERVVLEKRKR